MSSNARIYLAKPDETLITFELTLTAGDWSKLIRQLPAGAGTVGGRLSMTIATGLGEFIGRNERVLSGNAYHFEVEPKPEAEEA